MGRDLPYVGSAATTSIEYPWSRSGRWQRNGCQMLGCGDGLVEMIGHSCADLVDFARSLREARPS